MQITIFFVKKSYEMYKLEDAISNKNMRWLSLIKIILSVTLTVF